MITDTLAGDTAKHDPWIHEYFHGPAGARGGEGEAHG